MKHIILTGGGTAGHVTPNIALIPQLQDLGYKISYIGSYSGMERELITELGIPYYPISSGKLRRYFSTQNFTDPFRILKGFSQANSIVKKLQPDIIFSKGGFVTVPVVMAGKKNKIPTIIHESDMTPGLANKLAIPSATKVCCNFPETVEHLPQGKAVLTGCPIREELLSGDANTAKKICGFTSDKPVILIIGGSQGSVAVNTAVRNILTELLQNFQVIHLCGKGKIDPDLTTLNGYKQFEYVTDELRHLFTLSDVIISRAGANAICELLALRKPNILIPLPLSASRGDQILNANSFEKQGFSMVLDNDTLTDALLLTSIQDVFNNKDMYIQNMQNSPTKNATESVIKLFSDIIV